MSALELQPELVVQAQGFSSSQTVSPAAIDNSHSEAATSNKPPELVVTPQPILQKEPVLRRDEPVSQAPRKRKMSKSRIMLAVLIGGPIGLILGVITLALILGGSR